MHIVKSKINPLANAVENKSVITDRKDMNIFGIHLTTQVALDAFQLKSGMRGPYSVEYQHHYWAAVGRMEAGGQTLDVCVPVVMYNYPQEVTGASVKFNLAEVEDVSNQLLELADAKTKEFMASCGKKLTKTLGLKWSIVPSHTLHVHPGQLSSFSGTDYDKKVNDPGIVFPLSEATNQASFSSIMCHTGSKAKLVRTEYRLFTGTHEGAKVYRHGKCMSYVRQEKKENGPIEAMFIGNKVIEGSYVFKDGFTGDQGNEILKMISDIFDESKFEPSTDFIIEKNIKRSGSINRQKSYYEHWGKGNKNSSGVQGSLFKSKDDIDDIADYTSQELSLMRQFIVKESDFVWKEVFNMSDEDILFFYKEAISTLIEEKKKDIPVDLIAVIELDDDSETEFSGMDDKEDEEAETSKQYQFLLMQGIKEDTIMEMTNKSIEVMLDGLGYFDSVDELKEDAIAEKKLYDFLQEHGITDADLYKMDQAELDYTIEALNYKP